MDINIGEKLRDIRKSKNINIQEMSELTNLSIGLISQVERNLVSPSIDNLWKICSVLGISIGYLLEENKDKKDIVVRSDKRSIVKAAHSSSTYELLTPDLDRKIEFLYITLNPHHCSNKNLITHAGEECGIVISGELTVKYGDQEYVLNEGDSIYLNSTIPHVYINHTDKVCISIWAMTPPSF